jgi:hypothetical protein
VHNENIAFPTTHNKSIIHFEYFHTNNTGIKMVVTAQFKAWLKSNPNMKLSSDAAVLRVIKEGITTFDDLVDFDKKSLERLPATCKEAVPEILADPDNEILAEPAVRGANVSTISVQRLIVAMNAAEYYTAIDRTMVPASMHYNTVLKNFKIEWDSYQDLKKQDDPTVPLVNDKDNDRKIIKWVPIFLDCLSRTYGVRGPLAYVLRDDPDVPDQAADPLQASTHYGASGSLHDELIARLKHQGPIYKNDNTSVFLMIEKATRGTSVSSTVGNYLRRKDGRGAFLALISNHAGDTKYRAILKKRMNLLQNIKWNGRAYPLEVHVSNHRQSVDEIQECSAHITAAVPNEDQRVEYLIDSITCADNTLQAAIGLVRANTNNMRNDFEAAATALIEVDPYRRSQRGNGPQGTANVSSIDFSAGRGSTGVDLRWHPKKDFRALPDDQRTELVEWMKTNDGRKTIKASRKQAGKKRKGVDRGDENKNPNSNGNWKKKFKRAMKTPSGLKAVMSALAEEEKSNTAFVSALQAAFPTAPLPPKPSATIAVPPTASISSTSGSIQSSLPATSLKLTSILKRK